MRRRWQVSWDETSPTSCPERDPPDDQRRRGSSSMSTPNPAIPTPDRTRTRRVGAAALAGAFIEYYDFGLYGFLVVYLAPLFFPAGSPTTGLLATFGVLAVGYVM